LLKARLTDGRVSGRHSFLVISDSRVHTGVHYPGPSDPAISTSSVA